MKLPCMTCLTLALSRQKILLVFMSMCVKQVVLISLECIYHFRHELNRVTEYPVLIVVDDLNMFQNNVHALQQIRRDDLQSTHICSSNQTIRGSASVSDNGHNVL